jgi:hypothetical protein
MLPYDVKWVLHCLGLFKMVENTSILAVKTLCFNKSLPFIWVFFVCVCVCVFISQHCTFVSNTWVRIHNLFLNLTFIWVFLSKWTLSYLKQCKTLPPKYVNYRPADVYNTPKIKQYRSVIISLYVVKTWGVWRGMNTYLFCNAWTVYGPYCQMWVWYTKDEITYKFNNSEYSVTDHEHSSGNYHVYDTEHQTVWWLCFLEPHCDHIYDWIPEHFCFASASEHTFFSKLL